MTYNQYRMIFYVSFTAFAIMLIASIVIALKRAYDLNLDENNTTECYMACEYPIAFLKGNRTLADFGIRNGSSIIFRR